MGEAVQLSGVSAVRNEWSTLKKLIWLRAAKGGSVELKTLRGNPLVPTDFNLPISVQKVRLIVYPIQSGSGDPSPENIRPFLTWRYGHYSFTGQGMTTATYEFASDSMLKIGGIQVSEKNSKDSVIERFVVYDSYNGEPLAGRWMSSMDPYTEGGTPTIGAQVVDLERTIKVGNSYGTSSATELWEQYLNRGYQAKLNATDTAQQASYRSNCVIEIEYKE